MNIAVMPSRDDLLTNCERSMRYHQARRQFCGTIRTSILLLIYAFAGVGVFTFFAMASAGAHILMMGTLVSLFVGLFVLANSVDYFGSKISLHTTLYSQYTGLAGIIAAKSDASESDCEEWARRLYLLYGDEPPVYRALNSHCHNQMVIVLNAGEGYFVDLRWYHRWLRNFISFEGTIFRNRNQINDINHSL